MRNALKIAGERDYESIAFPLIGAGTGGYAPDKVVKIMEDEAASVNYDGEVRIVRFLAGQR